MKIATILVLGVSLIGGCAVQPPLYKWNNYSSSLYNLKKNPGTEAAAQHKLVLQKIINDSISSGTRVPPGVYAELGFLQMKDGQSKEAVANMNLESSVYPESIAFINRITNQSVKTSDVKPAGSTN